MIKRTDIIRLKIGLSLEAGTKGMKYDAFFW